MKIIKKIIKKIFLKFILPRELSKILVKSAKSKVYSKYCEKVYGKNLCQFNMTNMEQLNKMIEVLNLNKNSKVLDLGCATGTITEYISDITKTKITGIDYIKKAINIAQERTFNNHKLTFKQMDLNKLRFEDNLFDTIIAIDTLYFVDNLEKTIENLKRILKSNGKMAFFFTQTININESPKLLFPNNTKLAVALQNNNLNYEFYDFTELEKKHWEVSMEVAESLKDEFIKENNIDIYQSTIYESDNRLEFVKSNRISRYLYFIK